MARARRRVGEATGPDQLVQTLIDKAQAVTRKVERLKRVAHESLTREAVSRTELTAALHASLVQRGELATRLRQEAFAVFLMRGRPSPLRRHNRVSQTLDKAFARLGSFGQAVLIARSGVWRGSGRLIHDLRHMAAYARRGADPDVQPLTLFDQRWYLATYSDVAQAGMAPLVHYLITGHREGRSPHPAFSDAHYRSQFAQELSATSASPLEHYLRAGAARGGSPHALFDVAHYVAQGPALSGREDPLSHYLRTGGSLSPHPLFDPAWYAARATSALTAPPLVHYLTGGWREGAAPHALFDPRWYAERHPEAVAGGGDPLSHFLAAGAEAGFSPSPWFDMPYYLAARGEARPTGLNPLIDYLQGGAWAISEPRPGFPTAAYMAGHPEMVQTGLTPLEHWARRSRR